MTADTQFSSGNVSDLVPEGDAARQAVDSLRGYAYQVLASALAWVDLGERDRLYLEVAEDYAVMAQNLSAVQVKDTAASGSVTLNSSNIRDAIGSFVDLVARNPGGPVELHYITTSTIGTEKAVADRPGGIAGLEYWRKAAAGSDVLPLRAILDSEDFPPAVRTFVRARNDAELRRDLLQKIHWDCGARDFQTLHDDLQERLIVIGRDRFGLGAPDARRLADILAHRVLRKSVLKTPEERVLKRAELYEILGSAAEVAVPRAAFSVILSQLAAGMMGSLADGMGPAGTLAGQEPGWLIGSNALPTPQRFIARPALEGAVASAVAQFGAAILIGASGLGKSHVARVAAEMHCSAFVMVDFRDVDAAESRRRLDIVFGRIGGLDAPLFILEDLNHFDDPAVARALGRVMEALRRRDRVALVTCYRRPSTKAVAAAGINLQGTVDCPYFTEQETQELVALYGGNAAQWGRLAYVAGVAGHPQLTHAFVVGISARGWPRSELREIISRGLTTGDIDMEREAARRALIASLPENARNLLYRLSLTVGRFSRAIALVVGSVPPPLGQVGEAIDILVGPWIEAIGPERYRVSPLVRGAGNSQLLPNEQTRIHAAIAEQALAGGEIDASDANVIFMHALLGRSARCLMALASSVLTTPAEMYPLLAENLTFFQILNTERSIYPDSPSIAMMLRLAQFKLNAAAGEKQKAAEVAGALFRELAGLEEGELKQLIEVMVLSFVLVTMGVADYLDDWVSLLQRFKRLVESDTFMPKLRASFEEISKGMRGSIFRMLFAIGASQLTSVARLEHVIDELANLEPSERIAWLTPVDATVGGYAVLINGPCGTQQKCEDFNAEDASVRYSRLAEKTKEWGIEALSIQCWIARAVVLDEYLNDGDAALKVVDQAIAVFGAGALLLRAKAKIFWRRDDHPKALEILRSIADEVGGENPVEGAFALREAAISAAKCGDWKQAREWFADAQRSAASSQTGEMHGMAVGLGADAAVAALMDGDSTSALRGLARALAELAAIDSDSSLRAAYLHRVIRHAVLWAQRTLDSNLVGVSGELVGMPPGSCSNPDPQPSINELPLGALDLAWYMLAETEIATGHNEGIADGLYSHLTGGKIPVMEIGLRMRPIRGAIETSDADCFARSFRSFLDGLAFLAAEVASLKENFDPTNPPRGEIPECDLTCAAVEHLASDAILAFGMRAVYAGRKGKMSELQSALRNAFGQTYPGNALFSAEQPASPDLNRTIEAMLRRLDNPQHIEPLNFWRIGLRFFERNNQSNFGRDLAPSLAAWFRAGWKRIVRDETFGLTRPLRTVPPINAVLANPNNDGAFIAALLLTTSEAVGSPLAKAYAESLRAVATGGRPAPVE
jgi:hypothetical protein